MIDWSQLLQVWIIHPHMFWNIVHIDVSMWVVFIPKYILGQSIFVSGRSEELINGALNVVDFSILSSFENVESYQSDLRGILTISSIWYDVCSFLGWLFLFPYFLDVSDLIEYTYIFLNICSVNVLVYVGCNYLGRVSFSCEFCIWYIFQNVLSCCWFFEFNSKDPYIGPVYYGKITFPRVVVCWMGNIWHVVMFILFCTDAKRITSWWESFTDLKFIIFGE